MQLQFLRKLTDGMFLLPEQTVVGSYDISIAAAPHFPGLQHFKEGWGFKQWTGMDSKVLMKVLFSNKFYIILLIYVHDWQVYLLAIVGLVPPGMV